MYKQVTKLLKTPARTCLLCGERLVSRGKQKKHKKTCKVLWQEIQKLVVGAFSETIYSPPFGPTPVWYWATSTLDNPVPRLSKHHKQQKCKSSSCIEDFN